MAAAFSPLEIPAMCQVFISADPALYSCRARSVRLHGVATSIRLENLFWQVLEEIAARDGMGVPQLCARLHDELLAERGSVDNFASFLRVCCGRYLALQLSGGIPQDRSIPIRSLNPSRVLATEGVPAALGGGATEAAKCAALVLAGAALRLSWRAAGLVVQGFLLGNMLPMTAVVGQLYIDAPLRLCNAYLLDAPARLGQWLIALAALLALGWLAQVGGGMARREGGSSPLAPDHS